MTIRLTKRILLVITILAHMIEIHSAISGTTDIVITGVENGTTLRTYINAHTSCGEVDGNTITFYGVLTVNGTLTDSNSNYIFRSTGGHKSRLDWNSTGVMNFTDMVIRYTQEGANVALNYGGGGSDRYTANWTRVTFIQGTSGRSDFFNNGNYHFNFKDVSLISYGTGDFMHFQSNDTLRDISIIGVHNNLNFEPGGRGAADVETIINLKLRGVSKIVGAQSGQGRLRIENLDWDKNQWEFSERSIKTDLINPIKPLGGISYTGDVDNVREYYTHNVRVLDEDRNPISGVKVNLYCNSNTSNEYYRITNVNGEIPRYEVLHCFNSPAKNTTRSSWRLIVCDYLHSYYNQFRNFNHKIDEDILLFRDEALTETDVTKVQAYTKIGTAAELYDYAKYQKVKDQNSIKIPSYQEEFIRFEDNNLVVANNWKLVLDPNLGTTMHINNGSKIISVKCRKLEASSKFDMLVATGEIELKNGASINFPYKSNSTNSYVSIKDVMSSDTIQVINKTSGVILASFQGESGYAYQSHPTSELRLRMLMANGDEVMMYYKMNQNGYKNVFRMGIDDSFLLETMFLPTDRDRLFSIVDSLESKVERKTGVLMELLDEVIEVNKSTTKIAK
jgi:hypothetical protein